jgi:cell wall-associated NlpC family hydrolase
MAAPRRSVTKLYAAGLLASGIFVMPAGAQQGRAKMDETPRPFAKFSASAVSMRDSIVALAKRQVGVRYRTGASSPERGFDCSGLAKYVMAHFNIALPRTSREQALVGKALSRDIGSLKPGDLLTFGKGKRVSHVGIYIGGGKYVHASTPGSDVKEGSLLTGGLKGWWKGARRVIATADTAISSDSLAN